MAFSYQTVEKRVADCIRQFDYHAERGACPTNWRSLIKLSDVRFGIDSYNDSFPAKVFNSLQEARKAGFGWAKSFTDLGCIATQDASTSKLRKTWSEALRTDKTWSCNSAAPKSWRTLYWKTIKGCMVEIVKNDNVWEIHLTRNSVPIKIGTTYKNARSAQRAVRKLINEKRI